MERNENRIDELSRKRLSDLEKDPPPLGFEKIRKRVLWYSIWSLGIGTAVRKYWGIAVFMAVITAAFLWFTPSTRPMHQKPLSNTEQESSDLEKTHPALSANTLESADNSGNNIHQKTVNAGTITGQNAPANAKPLHQVNAYNNEIYNNDGEPTSVQSLPIETQQQHSEMHAEEYHATQPVTNSDNSIKNENSVPLLSPIAKLLPRADIQTDWFTPAFSRNNVYNNSRNNTISWSLYAGIHAVFGGQIAHISNEDQSYIQKENNISFAPELFIRADFGKWFINTGIQQSDITDQFSSRQLIYNETAGFEWTLISQYLQVDSTGYWHYTYVSDTAIHVADSVWAYDYDSLLVQTFDSTAATLYDTLQNVQWKREIKFVEVPLMFGRTFCLKRFSISIEGGIGCGILYVSEGTYYNGITAQQPFTAMNNIASKKLVCSFIGRGTVSYNISERMAIELSPWYRQMLTPIQFNETQNTRKPWSAGLSAGFRYFF